MPSTKPRRRERINWREHIKTLAFTGSQDNITERQASTLSRVIELIDPEKFIHGDCINSDARAHRIAKRLHIYIEVFPSNIDHKRAFCPAEVVHPPKPPLERNRDMIALADALVATPDEFTEELRSGTWATIRYARQKRIPRIIIWPNGDITVERSDRQEKPFYAADQ